MLSEWQLFGVDEYVINKHEALGVVRIGRGI
jgi:hypothetical protein